MKVTGTDAVANALRSIPEHLQREKVLPKALRAGADVVRKQAQSNLRAQGLVDTGLLADTLAIVTRKDDVPGQVTTTLKPSNTRRIRNGKLRRPVKYAHFSEYGTQKQPARPWFRPALATKQDDAVAKIREVTLAEVLKATRKAGFK